MLKNLMTIILMLAMSSSGNMNADASDVQIWQDPTLNFATIGKIFIMPINYDLKAGSQLIPDKQLRKSLHEWVSDGIRSAFGKGKRPITNIKAFDELINDMKFIYNDENLSSDIFFTRAEEMGYKAFVKVSVKQKFENKHVPEHTRTYTVYKDVEKRDSNGKLIETLRIPEDRTEIVPAYNIRYLHTTCEPRLYLTTNYNGDYSAIVQYDINREYHNGPAIKVVENIIRASMKNLFTVKK